MHPTASPSSTSRRSAPRAAHGRASAVLLGVLLLAGLTAACEEGAEPTPDDAVPTEASALVGSALADCLRTPALSMPAPDGGTEGGADEEPGGPDRGCVELRALSAGPAGLDAASGFLLLASAPVGEEALRQALRFEPPLDYALLGDPEAAQEEGAAWRAAYRIEPSAPLPAGTVQRVELAAGAADEPPARSWAYEVARPLAVESRIPADQAVDVPLDSAIEIAFSHEGLDGLEERMRIEPALDGRLEIRGRRAVFVPASGLAPRTEYRVRVEPGVTALDGAWPLEEAEAWAFVTGTAERDAEPPRDEAPLRFSRPLWETPTDEAPVLAVYATGPEAPTEPPAARLRAWRYPDLAAFLGALEARRDAQPPSWALGLLPEAEALDVEDLEPVLDLRAELRPSGPEGSPQWAIELPDALAPGFYALQLHAPDDDRPEASTWAFLQMTDLGAYAAVGPHDGLIWLVDMATGAPLEGAVVAAANAPDEELGRSAADGVARLELPGARAEGGEAAQDPYAALDDLGPLLLRAPDGRVLVLGIGSALQPRFSLGATYLIHGYGPADGYARFLYTDRRLYRREDALRFWGVVRARDGAAPPDEVEVALVGGSAPDGRPSILASARRTPGPLGTVDGELAFDGAEPGWYSLQLRSGETILRSEEIEIRDFTTPAYGLELSSAQRAVMAGEPVSLTARAAFYEGSPLPGLELVLEGSFVSETLRTDARGLARTAVALPAEATAGFEAYSGQYLGLRPRGPEAGEILASRELYVYPAAITAEAEARVEAGEIRVEGELRALEPGRLDQDPMAGPEVALAEPVPDWPLRVEITESRWEAVRTGERYDPLSRRVVPSYRYEQRQRALEPVALRSDAEGGFTLALPAEPERDYQVELVVQDDEDRVSRRVRYAGRSTYPIFDLSLEASEDGPFEIGDEVELRLVSAPRDAALPVDASATEAGSAEPAAATAETSEATAETSEATAETSEARYLFWLARNGLRDHAVRDEPRFALSFDDAAVPNLEAAAVRFDGRSFAAAPYGYSLRFDPAARAIELEIEPGRARYAPGEEATLAVRARDATGAPVAGAEVLLSAVDAAVLAAQGGSGDVPDILGRLYEAAGAGILRTVYSHELPGGSQPGGGGGGGGGRFDFRDTALFRKLLTDEDGRAELSFALPDNLSSWLVTGLAVDEGLRAGAGTASLPVGLPFFVEASLPEELLEGEAPVLRVRGFGDALDAGETVRFRIEAEGLLDAPAEREAPAYEAARVALPPLPVGRHRLRIEAAAAGQEDALIREIEVLPSRRLEPRTRVWELDEGEALAAEDLPRDRPIDVLVADRNLGAYRGELQRLAWSSGDRLDELLARDGALDLLAAHFDLTGPRPPTLLSVYEGAEAPDASDGGLALLPYGAADLPLSAAAALTSGSRLAHGPLRAYLASIAEDPAREPAARATALLGLSGLDEPALRALRAQRADASSAETLLPLGLAMAALGDEDGARTIWEELADGRVRDADGRARLELEAADEDRARLALQAATLAARLGDPRAPRLFAAAREDLPAEALEPLWELAYLQAALPRLEDAPLRLSLRRGGEVEEIALEPGGALALVLAPGEIEDVQLRVLSGAAALSAAWREPEGAVAQTAPPDLGLERSYERLVGDAWQPLPRDEDGAWRLAEEDLLRVTLQPRLPRGAPRPQETCPIVEDLLPSGLRAVAEPFDPMRHGLEAEGLALHPFSVSGQRLRFCAVRDEEGAALPLRSYARVAAPGTYRAEAATLHLSTEPGTRASSEAGELRIEAAGEGGEAEG